MQRRSFSREFKVEAVRLVRDRGVSVALAARDLDVQEKAQALRTSYLAHWQQAHETDAGRCRPADDANSSGLRFAPLSQDLRCISPRSNYLGRALPYAFFAPLKTCTRALRKGGRVRLAQLLQLPELGVRP